MAFSNTYSSSLSSILSNKTKNANSTHSTHVNVLQPFDAYSNTSLAYTVDAPHDDYMDGLMEVTEQFFENENPLECLMMIDTLQRLAIDYHFSEVIETILSRQYKLFMDGGGVISSGDDCSLYNVSLCFRLLRQNGYHVPADVFERFMDGDGEFIAALRHDLKGMMSLYEASQFGIQGEDILEKANAFTTRHLNESMKEILDQDAIKTIKYVLDNPYQKCLARFNVKHYMEIFDKGLGRTNNILYELAKVDFNIVQSLHQSELEQVSKWWRDLGLNQSLEFARDEPVKWYMWSLATLTDPMLSAQRIELTKPLSLVYILDDIFDVYGTPDQLVLLTEVINKWDVNGIEQLPDCMKIFFKALDDITNDISYKVLQEHGWNPVASLRKAWKSLCNAFLVEAKWFESGHFPNKEDYLRNAVVSSGVHVVLTHLFFVLGHDIRKDTVALVENVPGIISCTATILRLWDDLGSAKDENQEGKDGSYIKCYMKEHRGSTNENAREYVMYMISNEYKRLNKECLSPSLLPPSLRKASLNAARMVRLMYSYDENQQLPVLQEQIKSLLYEKLPLHK